MNWLLLNCHGGVQAFIQKAGAKEERRSSDPLRLPMATAGGSNRRALVVEVDQPAARNDPSRQNGAGNNPIVRPKSQCTMYQQKVQFPRHNSFVLSQQGQG